MRSPEQVKIARDRHPSVVKGQAGIVAIAADDVLPFIRRFAFDDHLEPVVLVTARVVVFELGQLADDSDVREPSLLLQLSQEAGLELLTRVETSRRDLDARVRVHRILEHEQLAAAFPVACHVGDDAAPSRQSTSSSAWGR
jgi:hypothetical protein